MIGLEAEGEREREGDRDGERRSDGVRGGEGWGVGGLLLIVVHIHVIFHLSSSGVRL